MKAWHGVKPQPWHKLSDPKLSSSDGWLDLDGVYYGCEWMGHMDLMDRMQELGCLPKCHYKEWDEKFVKVTKSIGGDPMILTYQLLLTPRQKLTLEKLCKKHPLFNSSVQYHLVADQEISMDGKRVRFQKIGTSLV